MSKSRGNFYTLRDLAAKGYQARVMRFLMLSVHYRKPLNFTFEALERSQTAITRLDDLVCRLERQRLPAGSDASLRSRIDAARAGMIAALDDDLNAAGALGDLFDLVREVHTALDAGRAGADDAAALTDLMVSFGRITGLRFGQAEILDAEVEEQIRRRTDARGRRDFAEADRIRQQLADRGILLEDTPQGVHWKRRRA